MKFAAEPIDQKHLQLLLGIRISDLLKTHAKAVAWAFFFCAVEANCVSEQVNSFKLRKAESAICMM
jgi:hypothetical protein